MYIILIIALYTGLGYIIFSQREIWFADLLVIRRIYLSSLSFAAITFVAYAAFWIISGVMFRTGARIRSSDMGLMMLFMIPWLLIVVISTILSAIGLIRYKTMGSLNPPLVFILTVLILPIGVLMASCLLAIYSLFR